MSVKISLSNGAPAGQRKKVSGAELLMKCLHDEKVKHLWCYPDSSILDVYDVLAQQKKIDVLNMRHEQAAVHAADGYARATGEVGVVLIPSGAGVTSAATGIAAAYMDSTPLVVISGQVDSQYIGQDAYQECDAIGITRPIVKHNMLVSHVDDLAVVLKKAFYISNTGRRGPVLVDVTKNVWREKSALLYPDKIKMRSYEPVLKGHTGQIKKSLQLLLAAHSPCIYIGGGVISADASQVLASLLDMLDMPVVSTMMGIGAYAGSNPRYLGMSGMHGTLEANMAIKECDVLLALGVRFGDRAIANTEAFMHSSSKKIIQIDIDPSSISKRVKVDVPVVGDVREVLEEMMAILNGNDYQLNAKKLTAWWRQINHWRKENCLAYDEDQSIMIKPQKVIELLWQMTYKDDVYITSDVGQHQLWLAQYYRFEKARHWISSAGLGVSGSGLPFALGVKKAFPKSEVFCVTSEISIQKNLQELVSSTDHGLPVIILNLNNGILGLAKQWHELDGQAASNYDLLREQPNFVKLAQAYGHIGIRVDKIADLEPAIKEAREVKKCSVFLDIKTDPNEGVYPIVPDKGTLSEMIFRAREGNK